MGKLEIRLESWKIGGKIGGFHGRLFRSKRPKILLCSPFDLRDECPEGLCCIVEILALKVHMLVHGLVYNDLRLLENLLGVARNKPHLSISADFGFEVIQGPLSDTWP